MALATSEGKLEINLQLDAKMSRVTKVSARVDPAAGVILAQNVRLQGSNSIEKFYLEFWLGKPPEFWLEISYTRKCSKIEYFEHVTLSKWDLKQA